MSHVSLHRLSVVCQSVDAWLMLHFVERVERVGHGNCLGEGAFVCMFQHLVLIGWKTPSINKHITNILAIGVGQTCMFSGQCCTSSQRQSRPLGGYVALLHVSV